MKKKYYSINEPLIDRDNYEIVLHFKDTTIHEMGIKWIDLGDTEETPFISISHDCFRFFFEMTDFLSELTELSKNFSKTDFISLLEKYRFYEYKNY